MPGCKRMLVEPMSSRNVNVAGCVLHVADRAGVDQLADAGGARMVRPHEAVHQPHAFRPAVSDDLGRFGRGRSERLFDRTCLPASAAFFAHSACSVLGSGM